MEGLLKDRILLPLWDYAILELPENSKSNIVLPDTADKTKTSVLKFEVLYTGPDCCNIKPHDKLVFDPKLLVVFEFNGRQYYLISERQVAVVVGKLRKMIRTRPVNHEA